MAASEDSEMRDSQHFGQGNRSEDGLSALARTVVARLVARDGQVGRRLDPELVAALAKAMAYPDYSLFEALRPELRRARISQTELVDSYFPAVARHLGCEWTEDRAAFTDVTLGLARMQSILHQVGRDWAGHGQAAPDAATVLLVLPEGEQHSFGAILMAGQLRRQGISVQLQIGASPASLRAIVQGNRFDCSMISVACEEKLDLCRLVVKALKDGSEGRLWVAVGGAVLDRRMDVREATGADMATNDPMNAIETARVRNGIPQRVDA
jgi:methanogenic corrinoid protein MtbC1